MDIIVFGTGEIGKNALKFLRRDYHILFLTDNDEKKWNTTFENFSIKSPNEIKKYDCNIVIASVRYGIDIAEQLQQMGVCQNRICFYHSFWSENTDKYEIYPLNSERVQSTEMSLIQYDLYQLEEQMTDNKKVLICCTFFSTYAKQLIENISRRYKDIEFSLLVSTKDYQKKIVSEKLKHIYYFQTMADLKTILDQLPVYDAMQLLWIEREWAYFYKLMRKKAGRLNLNVGGSDFYRTGKGEKDFKRNLIACADVITAETEATVREFETYYKEEAGNKIGLLPFGIEVLELINSSNKIPRNVIKEKYHIPPGKIVVTCGHNANSEHQHRKIIEALCRMPVNVREQIACIFPMTYPQEREIYISEIENRLKETNLSYVILTEFMDFQEMAEYALISDIMIHVQRTDQLSSTMLEEMYAGSIVIAGTWLPYQSLHDMGIFFLDVDAISDITESVEEAVVNIQKYKKKCAGNKEIVWKHSSWDELASRWHALWT